MLKKLVKRVFPIIVIVIIIFTQYVFSQGDETESNSLSDSNIEYLKSIINMVKDKYSGEISDKQLIEGALKGIFNEMDDYTTYYTFEEYNSFQSNMTGNYEGIGVELSQMGAYVVVTKVFSGCPGEEAGLLQGDKIYSVDGICIVGKTPQDASYLIKGEAGTKVKLEIIRDTHTNILTFEITRSNIKLNPIKHEIRNDIGYIELESFNSNAGLYMNRALEAMDENGINKIILDLRDNPGGYVDSAVDVAQYFVPEGLITKLDFKSENEDDREYKSNLNVHKYSLVVLVNGNTASASEILAGAIQETRAGVLVGMDTFGKAQVQQLIPILTPEAVNKYEQEIGEQVVDAYELITKHGISRLNSEIIGYTKITTGVYTTPSGKVIDENGLKPDVEVGDPEIVNGVNIRSIDRLSVVTKPSYGSEGNDVLNAEKILKLLNYDIDTPDMTMDEKTVDAVYKFRVDSGFYAGDVLDFTTQNELNNRLGELILEYDMQYRKAHELLKN
jgi:carboxyl-terminal processing protease